MKNILSFGCACAALVASAVAPVVTVTKAGAERITVAIDCPPSAFTKSLAANLELSGWFQVTKDGAIKVSGTPGASVTATGRGKQVSSNSPVSDDKSARMAARKLSDAMVGAFTDGGKGFAQTRIAFVNRKGPDNSELYMCYPDGYDIRQLTSDNRAAVGPRWAPNGKDIYYTGFLQKTPLVYRIDVTTGQRKLLAQFKGLATGAAISPDGKQCAIILSYQGNPELYVLSLSTGVAQRMTTTVKASEASPCWSPDGRRIAYVSDTTRHPQVYILDVATRKSVRFTSKGTENTNPDWADNGLLTWASKRAGETVICVADPAKGEGSARVVTAPGSWEHPSWAADGRHLVASRDRTLFLVDGVPDEDTPAKPVRLLRLEGNWMNPAFSR